MVKYIGWVGRGRKRIGDFSQIKMIFKHTNMNDMPLKV